MKTELELDHRITDAEYHRGMALANDWLARGFVESGLLSERADALSVESSGRDRAFYRGVFRAAHACRNQPQITW